jgi:hypothetical protein
MPGQVRGSAANAVPPLDDELAGALDETAGFHAGIDLIRDGIRLLATDRLTADQTQSILSVLAGSAGVDIVTAIAHLVQRLATAETNPGLRHLDPNWTKQAQREGEKAAWFLLDSDLHQPAAEAAAAIYGI